MHLPNIETQMSVVAVLCENTEQKMGLKKHLSEK